MVGDKNLIFANFFFWKPGTRLQKSLDGLVRSILHDILLVCPSLIPHCFPEIWSRVSATPWQVGNSIQFRGPEIRQAFSCLISRSILFETHRVCFFIDGLDEYEGSHQEDAKTLVKTLVEWTSSAEGNIKLCVSSREYNIFMNEFSAERRIRLHDLTRSDMARYVDDKLDHLDSPSRERLARVVAENAEGIFLWVAIVVRRIRDEIENGKEVNAIEENIEHLPKELDALYAHILQELPESDLVDAYQTFSMVQAISDPPYFSLESPHMPLSSYFYLGHYQRDTKFAIKESFPHLDNARELGVDRRIQLARKRLRGCCKGLLDTRRLQRDDEEVIDVTHRSIYDFITSSAQTATIHKYLEEFDSLDAIRCLFLADLLSRDASAANITPKTGLLNAFCIANWHKANFNASPDAFIKRLSATWEKIEGHLTLDAFGSVRNVYLSNGAPLVTHTPVSAGFLRAGAIYLHHPVYTMASLNNVEFVDWYLTRVGDRLVGWGFLLLTLSAMWGNNEFVPRMLDCLYSHGLRPTIRVPLTTMPRYFHPYADESIEAGHKLITIWQNVLALCYCTGVAVADLGERFGDGSWTSAIGIVCQKMLEFGASRNSEVLEKKCQLSDHKWEYLVILNPGDITSAEEGRIFGAFHFTITEWTDSDSHMTFTSCGARAELAPFGGYDWDSCNARISLGDLMRRCKFQNEAELLRLMALD